MKIMLFLFVNMSVVSFLFSPDSVQAQGREIPFVEKFALAEDRTTVLKELIPGTQDYYYYHALHFQQTGERKKYQETIDQWKKRHHSDARRTEIEKRDVLLQYENDPKSSLQKLRGYLGLYFEHQKDIKTQRQLATKLNPKLISRNAFWTRYSSSYRINYLQDSGLEWLIREEEKYSTASRRALLSRMKRPDYPQLVGLIAADLATRESSGFGDFVIHKLLLEDQLKTLLTKRPSLLKNRNYIYARIAKLWPSEDRDNADPEVRAEYLNNVWAFVQQLDPAYNNLKTHTLYQILDLKRKKGDYDRTLFLEYLQLPRQVSYVNPDYLKDKHHRYHIAKLNTNFHSVTRCPAVNNDEGLVRDFFQHIFADEKSYKPFQKWVKREYLKPLFAETKLLLGKGDPEQWYSDLSPSAVQAIKARVEINFALTNQERYDAADEVKLAVDVKNVKKLIARIYEINTLNYYLDHKKEVTSELKLDGLVANEEVIYNYDENPLRRIRREFNFKSLAGKKGLWVIELIGNGKSSRALVRKGGLQFVSHSTPTGERIRVFNSKNEQLKDATVWAVGRKYEANKDGNLFLPYSNQPGRRSIVLEHQGNATLDYLQHAAENYALTSAFYVDREALLTGKKAVVFVRPTLTLNGSQTTLKLLEDVRLTVETTDFRGIRSQAVANDFEVKLDGESTYEFFVPDQTSNVRFTLTAKVDRPSRGDKIDFRVSDQVAINQISKLKKTEALHLSKIGKNYIVEVLGKNGETIKNRVVALEFFRSDFKNGLTLSLKTNKKGRIQLGALKDIYRVQARLTGHSACQESWEIASVHVSRPSVIHAKLGEPIQVPAIAMGSKFSTRDISLLEVRGGTFTKDYFKNVSIKDRAYLIEDLPAGDYSLMLKGQGEWKEIVLRVAAGKVDGRYLLSQKRHLELPGLSPVYLQSVAVEGEELVISVANPSDYARVHIFGSRFVPNFNAYKALSHAPRNYPLVVNRSRMISNYLSGRTLGEEHRYIIERNYVTRWPGNMLTRPGLLLNPWEIRETNTGLQTAAAGNAYHKKSTGSLGGRDGSKSEGKRFGNSGSGAYPDLNFLLEAAPAFANLYPDKNGKIRIPLKELGDRQFIRVVALDPFSAMSQEIALDSDKTKFQDIRLAKSLDIKKPFARQQQVSMLKKGESLTIADPLSADVVAYDSLAKVYSHLQSLNQDKHLGEFSFVLEWTDFDDEKKQELYSKYACHELSFFLSHHDAPFFKSVVVPYLKNKRHKTFLDDYLLDADLSEYLKEWKFNRLNTVERILLARRTGNGEAESVARHIQDLVALLPEDIERENFLFESAVKSNELEKSKFDKGIRSGKKRWVLEELKKMQEDSAAPESAAAPESERSKREEQRRRLSKSGESVKEKKPALRKPKDDGKNAVGEEKGKYKEGFFGYGDFLEDSDEPRATGVATRQLYRQMEHTKEWAENNYYKLRIHQQTAGLIPANKFWADYAAWDGKGDFLSEHFNKANRNFSEMMLVLAVLDLPSQSEEMNFAAKGGVLTVTAKSPAIIFHREVKPAAELDEKIPLLVSQSFFDPFNRQRQVNNESVDRFITKEFLAGAAYGCQIVVTNPTSTRRTIDLLTQIPQKSLPISSTQVTYSRYVRLEPFTTQRVEFFFYFPETGKFPHYPVQVSQKGKHIASAEPFVLNVVSELSEIDTESWDYVSQQGTADEVITYLKNHNLGRLNLTRIAWRLKEKDFFKRVIALLKKRHHYHDVSWSYAILHDETEMIRQYLLHQKNFLHQIGEYIDTELLTLNPIDHNRYEHLEYSPLVNARTHRLGAKNRILNDAFWQQYARQIKVLSYHKKLDSSDKMASAYYLLLQDRIDEGLAAFAKVKRSEIPEQIQYDYFACYVAFYKEETKKARTLAEKYADNPVDRWRTRFGEVVAQLDEIDGKGVAVLDDENREQLQDALASTGPALELKVEDQQVNLTYANLDEVTVNYYEMDLEFLFSTNPFVSRNTSRFLIIRPNATARVVLAKDQDKKTFKLPEAYQGKNVLVEVVGGGIKRSQSYYAHELKLKMAENYGRLQVLKETDGTPLSKTYVKVYAKMNDGSVKFYKDGYTDLRGKFDYTSLNTDMIQGANRLAILIMHDKHGALVREVAPPTQ